MRKVVMTLVTFVLGAAAGVFFLSGRDAVQGQGQAQQAAAGFAAVSGSIGSEDVTGPYEVVKGWPKDVATPPGPPFGAN